MEARRGAEGPVTGTTEGVRPNQTADRKEAGA
jgi:hypothetical protein